MSQSSFVFDPVFNVNRNDGINDSERALSRICRRSFLRLWTFLNLYTDEGYKDGRGSAKELCDAFVVFGNDVIIFSDKNIIYKEKDFFENCPDGKSPRQIAWSRWYRRAIKKSCDQLIGAKSWVEKFPDKIFQDKKCSETLPIRIPEVSNIRFHLVAVARGLKNPSLSGQFSLLRIDTSVKEDGSPFCIGSYESKGCFVHVFDDRALEIVLDSLDTVTDFLGYLKDREELFCMNGLTVISEGEENLVARYITTMDQEAKKHSFGIEGLGVDGSAEKKLVFFDLYSSLKENPVYVEKVEKDRVSYYWDSLIDKFSIYGSPRYLGGSDESAFEIERMLRVMASESRFHRRVLCDSLINFKEGLLPNKRACRTVVPDNGGTVFVFLFYPFVSQKDYIDYRRERFLIMKSYAQKAAIDNLDHKNIIAIGFDNHFNGAEAGGSEDVLMIDNKIWSDEERIEIEREADSLGILKESRLIKRRLSIDEWPSTGSSVSNLFNYGKKKVDLRLERKRRKVIAKKSRKINRRK